MKLEKCSTVQNPYQMKSKMFGHIDTLSAALMGKKAKPFCLEIHPTNLCTHRCKECTSGHYRLKKPSDYISIDRLRTVLAAFSENQGKAVLWSGGGEPCNYACKASGAFFLDLAKIAADYSLQQGLYTNGSCLDVSTMDYLVKQFEFVRVSVDAFTAATHRAIRKSDDFNQVIHNLRYLVNKKKELHSEVTVGVSFVIREENVHDIDKLNEWLIDLPVDYIYFKPVVYKDGRSLPRDRLQDIFHQIESANEKNQSSVKLIIPYDKMNNKQPAATCFYHYFCPCLGSDGKVYQCCHHVYDQDYIIGENSSGQTWDLSQHAGHLALHKSCPANCRGVVINQTIVELQALQGYTHLNFM